MDRRSFLRTGAGAAAALAVAGPAPAAAQDDPGAGFDITDREPDENGIVCPDGFTSRIVARSGEVVDGTEHEWHIFPDGGATFAVDDGYVYVSNAEVPDDRGGVGAVRFSADGEIVDAYPILQGTNVNCAGGPTPWGTWLSCEEMEGGQVWECDPTQAGNGTALPALGVFVHEAVAVDRDGGRLYLTEDRPDGRFYRFTPGSYPDLGAGALEVATVDADGAVRWLAVPDPSAADVFTRLQVPESTAFDGGEGIVLHQGGVFFTTKGDNHVRRYDVATERMSVVYDGTGTLRGVDNIDVTPKGDLLVAEDGDDLELVLVEPRTGRIRPIARVTDNPASEVAGPAFDPSGTRLYFSSQRGGPDGIGHTYEISGPFHEVALTPTTTTTTTTTAAPATTTTAAASGSDGDDDIPLALPAVGGAALLAGAAVVWRLRSRQP